VPVAAFLAEFAAVGLDTETLWLMEDLFASTLDGRNASISPDLPRLFGRPPATSRQF